MSKQPIHEKHICQMITDEEDIENIKPFVNNAKFICTNCGRTANSEDNLCSPIDL